MSVWDEKPEPDNLKTYESQHSGNITDYMDFYHVEEMDDWLEKLKKRHENKVDHLAEDIKQITETMIEHRNVRWKAENKLEVTENTIHLLRQLVEDYLPEIGMTLHFREMFYQIVGEPYPDWLKIPEPGFYEREWIENHSLESRRGIKND